MWRWNQVIVIFCLVPTRQAQDNMSKLGDYMTLKVLERIDTLLLGMERNQELILSNKSLLQLKDSSDNVSNRSNLQDDCFKLLKTAREQFKIMKELFSTECPHPKETPIPQARSYLLNKRPFNWPLLPEEEAQIQFNQKLLTEHYRMIQATSRPRNSLHCVPLQQYFTTENGNLNWMLNCTTGTQTNVIIPLPANGKYPTIQGIKNDLLYQPSLNPCINTFPNHLNSDYLKYKYTGYPCYPLNPWKISGEHLLPLPTGRITYPFPLLPELPVWSPPESLSSMNNLGLSAPGELPGPPYGLFSQPQAIGWPAPTGPAIFANPYPEQPAPILPLPGLAPPQPIPRWPAPPGPVIFPNPQPPVWPPNQSRPHPNRWPAPPRPVVSPNPHPGPTAPPVLTPPGHPNPPAGTSGPVSLPRPPRPFPSIPSGVDLSGLRNLSMLNVFEMLLNMTSTPKIKSTDQTTRPGNITKIH